MTYWYVDHTDFRSIKESKTPDIFILGGIIISRDELGKAIKIIKGIKSKFTHSNMPIKWNLKDLEGKYSEFGLEEDHQLLLQKSKEWRKELFKKLSDVNYKIILSCIENFQKDKKLDDIKFDLLRYSFSNALMRVGFCAAKVDSPFSIVLDWPDSNNAKPFNREFYHAYNKAISVDGIEYYCGELRDLGFNDSLYFSNMNHSVGLQLSDLVIGAFRDGIKSFRDDHFENIGLDVTKIYLEKINGFEENKLEPWGALVSNSNDKFKECVSNYLQFVES